MEFDGDHVLVLAGAGTGKTRTIIERASWLINGGVAPRRILMMTFTRRAASEMIHRLSSMIGASASQIQAGTFHHFCLMTMRKMPKLFKLEGATVIDSDDQTQLMKLIRAPFKKKGKQFPQAAALLKIHSYARNTNQTPRDYMLKYASCEEKLIPTVCDIFKEYARRKQNSGYLDYDDILHRFAQILHASPEARERIRGLYDHILVDEMQDTNPLQWLILEGLRDPAKLYCVGDDAQSIYAFRGADFQNVHSFTKRVPNSKTLKLEENYRSTQEILDLSNWLLAESPLRYDKHLTAYRGEGEKPRLIDFDDEFEEAYGIVNDLIERHDEGAPWRDHMIITRTGFITRTLEGVMVEKKIPYRFIGGTSLMQAAHVKDLFSLVRCAGSHRDDLAWMRYLTLWPRIGPATASRIINPMVGLDNMRAALDFARGKLRGRDDVINGVMAVATEWNSPVKALTTAIKFLKPTLKDKYDNWSTRKKDLELIVSLAERHNNLAAFLEAYALDPISVSEADQLDEEDAVTLITVHSAKGTEAPVCYLVRAQPGVYPHVRSLGDEAAEEEERRVLYVAMTRAMNELILTRVSEQGGHRAFPGAYMNEYGSGETPYFLEDLPNHLVESDVSPGSTESLLNQDVIIPFRTNQ